MSFVLIPRLDPRQAAQEVLHGVAEAPILSGDVAALVQQEIARLRIEAETEGRARGEAQARAAVQAEVKQALQGGVSALREAWTQLASPLARKEQDLAELVTDLSFALARHIVGVEVSANIDSLRALVARLIREAAAERGPRQSIVVRLNPADHALLSPMTDIEDMHLLADAAISRGGANIEIIAPDGDTADKIEWDATIETRIASIHAVLALRSGGDAMPEAGA